MSEHAERGGQPDPLEKRPAANQGDTAVPAEGDVAQQPQTVDEDFTPQED
jgi:hypothetical protein